MTSIRLLHILNITILLNTCLLSSQHMVDHLRAQESSSFAIKWSQNLLTQVSPSETQLAANILYLLYANSLIDIKTRQFIIPITRLNQTIRSNILNYKTTNQELATLKTLLDRLSYIAGARTIYNQMLKTCLEYYNKHQISPLTQSILQLQTYGQQQLNISVTSHANELSEMLTASAKIFTAGVEPLNNLSKIYSTSADGSFAETLKANDATKEFAHLIIVDELLRSNIAAIQNSEYILNTIDNSTDAMLHLMSTAADIYKEHYAALYAHMSSDTFDQTYAYTLFDMYDLLPHEYRTLLPNPDQVFEHVLHTIKLYTQTEYIQN